MAKLRREDYGRQMVDGRLEGLEKDLDKLYYKAGKEADKKLSEYLSKYNAEDKVKKKLVADGDMTQAEYINWRKNAILNQQSWANMRDRLARDLTNTDKIATGMINDQMAGVYADSYNFGAYMAEAQAKAIDVDLTPFTIYNEQSVKILMKDDPDLLPSLTVDKAKDLQWNRQHIQSAVAQGIVQGDSMDKIAGRLTQVTGMDKNAAMRNARTATNSVENAGRQAVADDLVDQGIPMMKEWNATIDDRTRDSHLLVDGEVVEENERFSNGLMYAGDPSGDPAEVYNCRCATRHFLKGIDHSTDQQLYDQFLKENYYNAWLTKKESEDIYAPEKQRALERQAEVRRKYEEEKASIPRDEVKGYSDAADLERAIMNDGGSFNDARLLAYSNKLEEESEYNASLKNNLEQAISENGYTEGIKLALEAEEKDARDFLDNLPEMKSPEQIAQAEAMQERLSILEKLKPSDSEIISDIKEISHNVDIPSGARNALDSFEDKYRNKTKEYSMVVDGEGNIIGQAGGTKTSTSLSEAENLASEGNFHIHNHPLGDVIYSDQDVRNYEKYGVRGGIVVTKDGTEYQLLNTNPVSKVKDLNEIERQYSRDIISYSEYQEKKTELMPFSTEVHKEFESIENGWREERRDILTTINQALPYTENSTMEERRAISEERNRRFEEWKRVSGDDNERKARWLEENAEKYGFVFQRKKL